MGLIYTPIRTIIHILTIGLAQTYNWPKIQTYHSLYILNKNIKAHTKTDYNSNTQTIYRVYRLTYYNFLTKPDHISQKKTYHYPKKNL